jgi:hypothetical protein
MTPTDTVIHADDDTATVINVFDVDASNQQKLVEILTEGAEKVMQHRPGLHFSYASRAAELAKPSAHMYSVVSVQHA